MHDSKGKPIWYCESIGPANVTSPLGSLGLLKNAFSNLLQPLNAKMSMYVAPLPITTSSKFPQPRHTEFGTVFILSENTNLFKFPQPEKQELPIAVTLFGIVTSTNPEHPENAPEPKLFIPSKMSKSVIEPQFANIPSPTFAPLGSVTFLSLEHPSKICEYNEVTVSGITIVSKPEPLKA